MYNRISGTPFTVKNKEEQKEIINQINLTPEINKFFKCVGLEVEQFTGKINNALLQMGNKFLKFGVAGIFPTMKLTNKDSLNTFVVEFPNEKQVEKEVKIIKEEKNIEKTPQIINKIEEKTEFEKKENNEITTTIVESTETNTNEKEENKEEEKQIGNESQVNDEENKIFDQMNRGRKKKQLKY